MNKDESQLGNKESKPPSTGPCAGGGCVAMLYP
jgi:hypothetical protein